MRAEDARCQQRDGDQDVGRLVAAVGPDGGPAGGPPGAGEPGPLPRSGDRRLQRRRALRRQGAHAGH